MFRLKYLCCLFLIPVFSYGQGVILSVCERTPEVRTAIMKKVKQVDYIIECYDDALVFPILSDIETLDLQAKGIDSLKEGDFSGLSSLQILYLGRNQIRNSLSENIFSGLSSLSILALEYNKISTLPENVFSGLSSLRYLYLHGNQISYLPQGIFSGLSSLQTLNLRVNQISFLPDGVFSSLSSLQELYLRDNYLDETTKNDLTSYCASNNITLQL